MVVVLRKTILHGTTRKLNIPGIPSYEVEVTDSSIIYNGVEILTESLSMVGSIVELFSLKALHAKNLLGAYTKTDLGYLARDAEYLYLTNSKLEPVCKVPMPIFTALKLMSLKKNNIDNKKELPAPFLKSSKHAFVMSNLFDREELQNYMLRKDRFFKYGEGYYTVNREYGYNNLMNHIVNISGIPVDFSSQFIQTILNFNAYTELDERMFLIYNNMLLEISEYGIIERLPVLIPEPF